MLGQPDYIKKTLRDSGIYNTVVQDVLKQKSSDLSSSIGLSADQPQVQNILTKAITPTLLQDQAEKVIDNSFSWMQGETNSAGTTLDLSSAKQQIADNIGTYTTQYLQSLPACAPGTLPNTTDPLQINCRPAGYDVTAAANEVKAKVLGSDAFQNNNITLGGQQTSGNNALSNQFQGGPRMYQGIELAVYAQAVLAVLSLAGLILLSPSWRLGIRRVGVIALWTGIVNAGLAWLSSFAMHMVAKKLAQTAFGGQPLQQKLAEIAEVIVDDIRAWWLCYGIILVVLGIVLLVTYRLTRPSAAKVASSLAKEESASALTASDTPPTTPPVTSTPAQTPKPPKRPRKIQ